MPAMKTENILLLKLDVYGISEKTGFMPFPPPLWRLTQDYFKDWEGIMEHLNPLILNGGLRKRVQRLPLLSTDGLTTKAELRRAFIVLTFIAHGYMYGVPNADEPIEILPKSIAIPWFEVAGRLNINPVVSYSSTALWNWYLIDSQGPMDLSNLASMHTFTGSYDESWFYLVPLSIELAGAPAIPAILKAQKSIVQNEPEANIAESLHIVGDCVEEMIILLKRIYERCDASVFWKRIRQYSGGSKNSDLFPNGVFYEGVTKMDDFVNTSIPNPPGLTGTWRKYPGASAGQSPMIHTLDVAFGIEHKSLHGGGHAAKEQKSAVEVPVSVEVFGGSSTMEESSRKHTKPNPMLEMRESLPYEFQLFIKDLAFAPSIREYCLSHRRVGVSSTSTGDMEGKTLEEVKMGELSLTSTPATTTSSSSSSSSASGLSATFEFNRICKGLKTFRDLHMQVATHYIILQKKAGASATGTGGTPLVDFLKQTRQETEDTLIK